MTKSNRSKRQKGGANKPSGDKHINNNNKGDDSDNERISFKGIIAKITKLMGNNKLDAMSTKDIFTQHPLIRVGKFVLIPYLLYYGYYYVQLQHPEYVSKATGNLINLRPAIHGTNTSRQVLIVATPGSGTVQMTNTLKSQLSLEVGHENADVAWKFNRDGTISWFHGIRFFNEPKDSKDKVKAIAKICNTYDYETHSNMGFHPAMYGPPISKCSYRGKWDECWKSECYISLLKEWGCAVTNTCHDSHNTTFVKNLHQVRNPMHNLESLVSKYCIGGVDGLPAVPFWTYASALFPGYDNFFADSCIEAAGYFMVLYLEQMAAAKKRGDIDGFYRIEETSPCEIAEMAGLLSTETTVYDPNFERISKLCDKENNTSSPAQQVVEKKLNKRNKDGLKLGWEDLLGGAHGSKRKSGDKKLQDRIKKLFKEFGYDESLIPETVTPLDTHIEL